jgi:hypothetical protein
MTISEGTAATSPQGNIVLELAERCESHTIRITRTTFPTPLLNGASEDTRSLSIDLARFIAGPSQAPSDRLITGLNEQIGRLGVAVCYERKKRLPSELKRLALRVHMAARYLQTFPENGQLPKSKMRKVKRKVKILQDFLEDSELLSYVFEDNPALVPNANLIAESLKVISKRSRDSDIRTNGAPKKQEDIQIPYWDQFVPGLIYIADIALKGASVPGGIGRSIKKRMTPLPEKDMAQSERARRHQQDSETFSSRLLCAVIIGVAYSAVSVDKRLSKSGVTFSKNASEACEKLWLAAGGVEHEQRNQGEIYPCWVECIKSARRMSYTRLVRDVRRSF